MLRRKAYENLLEWKKTKQNETLLIKGARQIGKTFLVRQFGQNEYESFIEINFLKNPDFKAIFEGELTADEIFKRISAHIPSVKFIKGSTLIFLDEIQKCSRART
ncbi:MAG: AAA family ATPase, partial [Treponema sp.]|nr:AAA family ATPase [Treponema sp.]